MTGVATYWGARLAQALEGFEQIGAIIGVNAGEPRRERERTEFVKVSNQHSLIQRILRAAEIDDRHADGLNSLAARPREAHVLRCANVLGPDVDSAFTRMFSLPLVPTVIGFEPRLQFVHEDDVVHALEHAALEQLPGTFNVAADGVLALSEAIDLLGKRALPAVPPFGGALLAAPLRRLGVRIPDELGNLLRFGRGVDGRLYQATDFDLRLHLARDGDPARRAPAPATGASRAR